VAQGHQGIDGQHALRGHNGGDRHKRFADGQGGAAFGRVVEGVDVIRKIQQQPVKGQILSRNEPSDKPGTIQLSRIVSAPIDVDVDTAASTIVTIQEDSLTAMAGTPRTAYARDIGQGGYDVLCQHDGTGGLRSPRTLGARRSGVNVFQAVAAQRRVDP
jgi:hypothetical protein